MVGVGFIYNYYIPITLTYFDLAIFILKIDKLTSMFISECILIITVIVLHFNNKKIIIHNSILLCVAILIVYVIID